MTSKMKVTRRLRRRFGRLCASKVPDDGRPHDDDAKGDEPRTPHQMLEMGEIVSEGVAEGAIEHRPDERTESVPEEEYPKGHVGDAGEQPAGVTNMPFWVFFLWNALGALVWSVLYGDLGYAFG